MEFHCEHVAVRLDPDVITVTQPSVHVRRQRSLTIQKYSWRRCTREAGADQALELLAGMRQIGLEPDVSRNAAIGERGQLGPQSLEQGKQLDKTLAPSAVLRQRAWSRT